VLGPGEVLAATLEGDAQTKRAVLRRVDGFKLPNVPEGSVVARINGRVGVKLSGVLEALTDAKRPLLFVVVAPRQVVPPPPPNAPAPRPHRRLVELPRGPLGLRLTERFTRGRSVGCVEHVSVGGPAWRAGARAGWCVVSVGGVAVGGHGHALALLSDRTQPASAELEQLDLTPLPLRFQAPAQGFKPLARARKAAETAATHGRALLDRGVDAAMGL
jgi:hypothetical protein